MRRETMAKTLSEIEKEALKLSENERADLASRLIDSLEPKEEIDEKEIERLQLEEIRRRVKDIDEGRAEYLDGDRFLADIEKELNEKNSV